MSGRPSPNGANGRDSGGRFAKGNAGGPGNPLAKKVGQLRSALLASITESDVRQIAAALVEKAKTGDIAAAREVLDRTLGKTTPPVIEEAPAEKEDWRSLTRDAVYERFKAMGVTDEQLRIVAPTIMYGREASPTTPTPQQHLDPRAMAMRTR